MATKKLTKGELPRVERLRRQEMRAAVVGISAGVLADNGLRGLKHGVTCERLMNNAEREIFYTLVDLFDSEYEFNKSADWMSVELANLYFLQVIRAVAAGNTPLVIQYDGLLRGHLREMKASKRGREGDENKRGDSMSPDQWAATLIAKVAEANAGRAAARPIKTITEN